MTQQLSTNTFGVAKWVVSADATQGTHTTIAAALASASSGDTIYIRTGTYTEDPTLKAGVNLCALPSESGMNGSANTSANVIIKGICTLTTAGTVTISGIQLQTNSNFFLAVTGSAASIVNLFDCYLNCLNNTGISFTTSSSSAQINIYSCTGNIALTSISLAACTSPGTFQLSYCDIESNAVTTTASTFNTTVLNLEWSLLKFPITMTAGNVSANYTQLNTANTTCFTSVTSGISIWEQCQFIGGTSSAISVGASTTVSIYNCVVFSSNTNAITGAGTLNYIGIAFSGSSSLVNTTTKTGVGLPTANGAAGTVLTSNGAGLIPTFQSGGSGGGKVTAQRFTATGALTYTPTANMVTCIITLVGAGGGSGGCTVAAGVSGAATGGGGGGSCLRMYATAAQIGASATGSVGTAGTAGSAGNNAGGNGGNTTFTIGGGTAWTAAGGNGSAGQATSGTGQTGAGGAANANTTGTNATLIDNIIGQSGQIGTSPPAAAFATAGLGGSSGGGYGNGGQNFSVGTTGSGAGSAGSGFGSGGGGSCGWNVTTNLTGAAGANGYVVITEFLSG